MNKQSNTAPGTSQATKKNNKSPTKSKAVKKTATTSGQNKATSTKDKQPTEPKATKKATAAPGTSGINITVTKKSAKQPPDPKAEKKTTLELVCEAIGAVGVQRKGASVQAIKKYITSNAENGLTRQNAMVNRALVKGIEKGILTRPAVSKNMKGATGYFTLAKKEVKPKKEKADAENHGIEDYMSDSEITKKPAKPRKRALSDSDANKLPGAITSTPRPPKIKKPTVSKDPQNTKKAPVKKDAAVKKYTTETASENSKPASSETFSKTTKELQKKTKAGKQKSEKPSSQAKAPKTEKPTSQAKAPRTERARKLFDSEGNAQNKQ